jgi:hypothetical protein
MEFQRWEPPPRPVEGWPKDQIDERNRPHWIRPGEEVPWDPDPFKPQPRPDVRRP